MNPQQGYTDRDWKDDFSHENGKYINICMDCKLPFYGHKRRVVCHKCAEAPTQQPDLSAIIDIRAELSRLTEKYSQKCERCGGDGHHLLEDCSVCHGTGRVWMMGVEEVKKLQKDLEDERHEWFNRACTRILEGGGK